MKKIFINPLSILLLLSILIFTAACNSSSSGYPLQVAASQAVTELSDEEAEGLLHMREEEKLARDLYNAFYEMWGLEIFSNIAESEESHYSSVSVLIEKYNPQDYNMGEGEFQSRELQELYNTLLAEGQKSALDALRIGATVEDLDISDLNQLMTETEAEDILFVYGNLLRGSRNHMRAFSGMLERYGAVYTPVYITQDEYDSIISSSHEGGYGFQGKNGNGNGMGKGCWKSQQ